MELDEKLFQIHGAKKRVSFVISPPIKNLKHICVNTFPK